MKKNSIGLSISDYSGSASTLCTGCGHDSVTKNIISAYFQSGVHPFRVAKLSGIGCSSKTPAYFMSHSFGFNSIHGRMASVATGVRTVNRELEVLGISGDGDTASIGLGGFIHLLRRNVRMVYLVENNGVYGLTKGQFSATADKGSVIKKGEKNPFETIDLCSLAIEMGCDFVARSFSGDSTQLVPLIQAAIRHNGTAFIDVISPCITYANHEGSTKSYDYVKEHKVALQELGFIEAKSETVLPNPDQKQNSIELADGSYLVLTKRESLNEVDSFELTDRNAALKAIRSHRENGEILTGLLFYSQNTTPLEEKINLSSTPLVRLPESDIRLSQAFLDQAMKDFC